MESESILAFPFFPGTHVLLTLFWNCLGFLCTALLVAISILSLTFTFSPKLKLSICLLDESLSILQQKLAWMTFPDEVKGAAGW